MPTYDYVCDLCAHAFEHFQGMSEPLLRKCPRCGKPGLRRLIGAGAGVLFKGSGFYETDYKRKPAPGSAGSKPPTDKPTDKTTDTTADKAGGGKDGGGSAGPGKDGDKAGDKATDTSSREDGSGSEARSGDKSSSGSAGKGTAPGRKSAGGKRDPPRRDAPGGTSG